MNTTILTGHDLGVCAGVIYCCEEAKVPYTCLLPADHPLTKARKVQVGFVPFMGHPQLVEQGFYPCAGDLPVDWKKHFRKCPHVPMRASEISRSLNSDFGHFNIDLRRHIRRDFQIVDEATRVFVFGHLSRGPDASTSPPMGGQGWILNFAQRLQKPLYLYEMNLERWLTFDYKRQQYVCCREPPVLEGCCAVAGSRQLTYIHPAFKVLKDLIQAA